MKPSLALTLALVLLASCGGGSDPKALTDSAYGSLRSGNYQEAARGFDQALAALGEDRGPAWVRAKMGAIEARTQVDAPRAKDELLELAGDHPSAVTDKEYSLIGGRLGEANALKDAVAVLEAGMKAYPESPHLQALMMKLGDKAKSSGNTELQNNLKGLGYVGD